MLARQERDDFYRLLDLLGPDERALLAASNHVADPPKWRATAGIRH